MEKYRGKQPDIRAIAADLQVDTLLTGNFIRDGENLRIISQLIDVSSENILWKGSIDVRFANLLMVHDNVAQQIIKGPELSGGRSLFGNVPGAKNSLFRRFKKCTPSQLLDTMEGTYTPVEVLGEPHSGGSGAAQAGPADQSSGL